MPTQPHHRHSLERGNPGEWIPDQIGDDMLTEQSHTARRHRGAWPCPPIGIASMSEIFKTKRRPQTALRHPGPTVGHILNVRTSPIPTVALASAPAYSCLTVEPKEADSFNQPARRPALLAMTPHANTTSKCHSLERGNLGEWIPDQVGDDMQTAQSHTARRHRRAWPCPPIGIAPMAGIFKTKRRPQTALRHPGPTVGNILNVRASPIPTVALASAPAYSCLPVKPKESDSFNQPARRPTLLSMTLHVANYMAALTHKKKKPEGLRLRASPRNYTCPDLEIDPKGHVKRLNGRATGHGTSSQELVCRTGDTAKSLIRLVEPGTWLPVGVT